MYRMFAGSLAVVFLFGDVVALCGFLFQPQDIMTLKRKGEVELEEIYAGAPKGVSYTVLRPGGLTDGPVVGPAGETVPDTISKAVSRADEYIYIYM